MGGCRLDNTRQVTPMLGAILYLLFMPASFSCIHQTLTLMQVYTFSTSNNL